MKPSIFETDPAKKLYPKFIYQRIQIDKAVQPFFYKIDFSSGYFLRRAHCKYPSLCKDTTLPAWSPGAAVAPGDFFLPSVAWQNANKGNNLLLQDTGAGGLTGLIEPVWSLVHGDTTADNTVTWLNVSQYSIPCPQLKIEFFDNAHYLARQPEPIPFDLIGTPAAQDAFLIDAPNPVDLDGYGLNFNVPNPPTLSASLNWTYKYGDVIKLQITGQTEYTNFIGSKQWTPNFVDLFLIGYYLPTGTLENF